MTTNPLDHPGHAPRIVDILNPIVRRLLGVGVPMGPNTLLTVTGRTSGLPRTFPIAILESDRRLFVQSPFGEVNWVRNLRADGHAALVRDGHEETVDAVELTPEAAEPILRAALAPYHRNRLIGAFARLFIPIDPTASRDAFIEHVRLHPMFELRPRWPGRSKGFERTEGGVGTKVRRSPETPPGHDDSAL
jgi:deazaflavin-dependent oxidoreductase (nitroreductase family)